MIVDGVSKLLERVDALFPPTLPNNSAAHIRSRPRALSLIVRQCISIASISGVGLPLPHIPKQSDRPRTIPRVMIVRVRVDF
jgi:hypothetical protein